jgi:DNA repair exonuclease SbcCD ATPase subunit
MFTITKLVIQNFLPYREKQTLSLTKEGIVRVEGKNLDDPSADSNMVGKSAILDAISWVLYKKTLRGVSGDEVIHRKSGENCRVAVCFESERAPYQAIRYRKHSLHRNGFRLLSGNPLHDISHRHGEETQKTLERILGCSFPVFVNSVVFGGAKPFASLSDAEQKKVLESFLNFEQIDRALKITKGRLSANKERLQETQIEVERQKGKCHTSRANFAHALSDARQAARRREDFQKNIDALYRRVSKLGKASRAGEIKERMARLNRSEQISTRSYDQTSRRVDVLRDTLQRIKQDARYNATCSSCGQAIPRRFIKALRHKESITRRRLEHEQIRCDQLEEKAKEARRKLDAAKENLEEERRRDYQIEILETRIQELKEMQSHISQKEPSVVSYSNSVQRLLRLDRKQAKLIRTIRGLKFWEVGFGNQGIKATIVREALPALNSKLQEYSSKIFGEDVHLKFLPAKTTKAGDERELFHVSYTAKRGGASYLAESTGGRRRVDICVLLVFAWFSRTCNLLLVDELLDGLDNTGRLSVLSILERLRGTVLVISHRKDIKNEIGKVWTVIKRNGQSTVEII